MIVKPIPDSDLGMYVPAEEPEKKHNGKFKVKATADKGTYRYAISTKLNHLSQSNGIRKAKDKIQSDLKKEYEAALKLSKSKSLGTYTHDPSKCHALNPETNPNSSDEEYEQMHREIEEEKQKQQRQKKKASNGGCCDSSSCRDCSSSTKPMDKDEVRYCV